MDNKYKRAISNNLRSIAFSGVFISFVVFIIFILPIYEAESIVRVDHFNKIPIGEITDGIVVEQSFICHENGLDEIDILFATYARKNTSGIIKVSILDDKYNLLSEYEIPTESFLDNAFVNFEIPRQNESKDKKYMIRIENRGSTPGNAITLWANSYDYENMELEINGESKEIDLVITMRYLTQKPKIALAYFFLIVGVTILTLMTLIPSNKH